MPSRRSIATIYLLLAVLLTAAWVGDRVRGRRVEAVRLQREAAGAVIISELRMEGRTFRETLEELSRSSGTPIELDAKAMATVGIVGDEPMSLVLFDLPMQRTLDLVLGSLSERARLAWLWQGDRIVITTDDERMKQAAVTCLYDVRDLNPDQMRQPSSAFLCFSAPTPTTAGGGIGAGGGLFGAATGTEVAEEAVDPHGHPLCRLLMDVVDPAVWRYNGGAASDMQLVDGRIIVTAPPEIQQHIAMVLGDLRQEANTP